MKYGYCCKKHGNIYEVEHSMNIKFSDMKELVDYVLTEGERVQLDLVGGESILFEDGSETFSEECLEAECGEIYRIIYTPQVIFKGEGWFSKDNKRSKYQGKHKKMMEKMREDRANRRKTGMSTVDAAKSVGLETRGGSVVENAQWDQLSTKDVQKARSAGLRPSREWKS